MKKIEIKKGEKFGFLTIIKEIDPIKNSQGQMIRKFLCKCVCGKTSNPNIGGLRSGQTTSCGCKFKEGTLKWITKHGMYGTRTNLSWNHMIQRCTNKKNLHFKDYGGRGIKITSEWLSFKNFLKDMGVCPPNMTLGRIKNNKGYSKENCRWETRREQARNRRSSIFINFRNKKKLMIEWAEVLGLNYHTLYRRLFVHKWSYEKALTTLT